MTVELLHVEGCPQAAPALERLRAALQQEGVAATVRQVLVRSEAEAHALRFFASPTIRVNGRDVEAAPPQARPSLACRLGGPPTAEAIRERLREAR